MFSFITRRLLASLLVLLGATFILYMAVAYAVDPLQDLRTSTAANKEQLIEARIRDLNLETPPILRYFIWLRGVVGFLWGQGDLGESFRTNASVGDMLASAVPVTLQLVLTATIIAIVLGVIVGIGSALRQYTGFDYTVTFLSFLLYSLPAFWVAVLLKQWGAIGFNDFLRNPVLGPLTIILLSLVGALIIMGIVGGHLKRRLITFGTAAAVLAAILAYTSATSWLLDPSLGPVVIAVTGFGIAIGSTALFAGLRDKRALYSTLTTVVLGVIVYFALGAVLSDASGGLVILLGVVAVVVGAVTGRLFGGPDWKQSSKAAALTAFGMGSLVYVDQLMQVWYAYTNSRAINHRPIATIGSSTPNLTGNYWITTLDSVMHVLMPTIALILISFASYTRYSRASLLEVMNQDYIRTARAKGLPERLVVVRHAFRNALIPLATIIPLDIAALFGGAVITERVFGWKGMGSLFLDSLLHNDLEPIMGYFLVTGSLTVLANMAADFVYAGLDPRIRVSA